MSDEDHMDAEMVGIVRGICEEAGTGDIPFLDDAVRKIVAERDRARRSIEALAALTHDAVGEGLIEAVADVAANAVWLREESKRDAERRWALAVLTAVAVAGRLATRQEREGADA